MSISSEFVFLVSKVFTLLGIVGGNDNDNYFKLICLHLLILQGSFGQGTRSDNNEPRNGSPGQYLGSRRRQQTCQISYQ